MYLSRPSDAQPKKAVSHRRSTSGYSLLSAQWSVKKTSSSTMSFTKDCCSEYNDLGKVISLNKYKSYNFKRSRQSLSKQKLIGKSHILSDNASFSRKMVSLYSKPEHSIISFTYSPHQMYNREVENLNDEDRFQREFNTAEWFKNFDGFSSIINYLNKCTYPKLCLSLGVQKEDYETIIQLTLNNVSLFLPNLFSGSTTENRITMKRIKECQNVCCGTHGFHKSFSIIPIITSRYIYTGRFFNSKTLNIELEKNADVFITIKRDLAQRVTKSVIYMNIETYLNQLRVGDVLKTDTGIRFKIKQIENGILSCKIAVSGLLYSYTRVHLPRRFQDPADEITYEEMEDLSCLKNISSQSLAVPLVCTNYKTYYKSILETLEMLSFDNYRMLVLITAKTFEQIYFFDPDIINWLASNFEGIIFRVYDRQPMKNCMLTFSDGIKKLFDKFYQLRKPIILGGIYPHCSVTDHKVVVESSSEKYLFYYPDKYLLMENEIETMYIQSFLNIFDEHYITLKSYSISLTDNIKNSNWSKITTSNKFARFVTKLSYELGASAILLLSKTGKMAAKISHFRPKCPIIVTLDNPELVQYFGLYHNIWVAFYTKAFCKSTDYPLINLKKVLFATLYGIIYGIITVKSRVICVYKRSRGCAYPDKISTFVVEKDVLQRIYDSVTGN